MLSKQLLSGALGIVLAILLQGCAATFSGYAPTGPGKLEGRLGGIKDVLRIEIHAGVQVVMSSDPEFAGLPSDQTLRLAIALIIPEGASVRLLSPGLVVESAEWTQPKHLMIHEITEPGPYAKPYPGPRRYPPTAVLDGATRKEEHWFATYANPAVFTLWFVKEQVNQTLLPKVQSFTLRFPGMLINDRAVHIDPVRFDAYTKRGVMYP